LIPVAPAFILTLSPMVTSELVIVTIPVVMVLLSPSMVTDELPIVRIPTILASPRTKSAVVAVPELTSSPLLNVEKPRESTCLTSSYVMVPPTVTFPVASMLPETKRATPDFADVVLIPTTFAV
jgi:hypothetical protein